MAEKENIEAEPKQRIMDAAIKLFARNGYGSTGMRELAKEADVNLAMINGRRVTWLGRTRYWGFWTGSEVD